MIRQPSSAPSPRCLFPSRIGSRTVKAHRPLGWGLMYCVVGAGSVARIAAAGVLMLLVGTGCNSMRNGWLDPTVVGNFTQSATMEIRHSLTIEDEAEAIPGAEFPGPQDLELHVQEHPISGGDLLSVEIDELRDRLVPYREPQLAVAGTGYIQLPVLGRVQAAGLTVPELEDSLRQKLKEMDVLVEPDVIVRPIFLQKSTYSVFGVGVSAANDAPLRAGTFPILRPDLRLLEAINQVGGLNEFVSDVYIFRYDRAADTAPARDHAGEGDTARGDEGADDNGSVEPRDRSGANGTSDPGGIQFLPWDLSKVRNDQPRSTEPGADAPVEEPRPDERAELLDVIEEGPAEPPEAAGDAQAGEDILAAVDEGAIDPFLFVDGAFVPNPAYRGERPGAVPMQEEQGTFDLTTPGAKWARLAGETTQRILRVPAESLRRGEPSANIFVRAGDVIRIVSGEIGVFYVMGQVNRVGAFTFNAEQITLKSAIAGAGGLSPLAWPDRCTVYRRVGQREQMIQVDLDRIFAGKDADFLVRRGDIINVGTHPFAPFLQRVRALTLPNITSNVGYSFTYARNFADIDSFESQINPRNLPGRFDNLLNP